MKRILVYAFFVVLALSVFSACRAGKADENTLVIGATPVPHAQLLELVSEDLKEMGITLKIIEFNDYIQPNAALMAGELDANFFQHTPYLETNAEWMEKLASAFGVHVEPFGLYSSKFNDVNDLPNGASIAIPNDPTNGGRALLLLQSNGLIGLREDAGLRATPRDVTSNPRNFRFVELEAAFLPRSLQDVDAATINGNFALQAGFNPLRDALIIEGAESPYVNIVVVQKGKENEGKITVLKEVLLSDKVRAYILDNYNGGVAAVF